MERSHRGYSHEGEYIQELPARQKKKDSHLTGKKNLRKSLKFFKFLLESIWKTPHFSALLNPIWDMTQHNSFKAAGGAGSKNRTVLKRFERVDLLKKRKEWEEGQRVVGLKKTKPEE